MEMLPAGRTGYPIFRRVMQSLMASSYNPFIILKGETHRSSTLDYTESGTRFEREIETKLYRCEGIVPETSGTRCFLVWDRARQARDCALNGHRNQYRDYYYTQYQPGDGLPPVIVEYSYVRRAIRRDGPKPVFTGTQAKAPEPRLSPETTGVVSGVAPASAPVLSLAEIKALALAQGYRLSRIPSPKVSPGEPETPDTEPVF